MSAKKNKKISSQIIPFAKFGKPQRSGTQSDGFDLFRYPPAYSTSTPRTSYADICRGSSSACHSEMPPKERVPNWLLDDIEFMTSGHQADNSSMAGFIPVGSRSSRRRGEWASASERLSCFRTPGGSGPRDVQNLESYRTSSAVLQNRANVDLDRKISEYKTAYGQGKCEPQHKKIDLHKKTIPEATAGFRRYFNRQLQYYKENGYRDQDRFIFVITGHCKNRPGRVARIKPEIQDLLHRLHVSHIWFNNEGEVILDLRQKDQADIIACNCPHEEMGH
ncbi:trichohyalin [Biomphalaria pfeifferi]|uniref:Trichohyalin n=1 Tax=Biomphalaria pfeifferi TaxID=112525 RepID=A0AAD8BES1_BIOPF|nr:trichohyalin [Biomphalaria pfeifferi]